MNDFPPSLRLFDANANRAAEGLRVVEDYLRFELDDPFLCGRCKTLRHRLAELLAFVPLAARHAMRESTDDAGRHAATASEYVRREPNDVAAASLQRAAQALRCLEEYGKLISIEMARQIEQLRYELYTLEKAISHTRRARERLANSRLYVLIDTGRDEAPFLTLVEALVAAEVDAIQLRDLTADDRTLYERAKRLRETTRGSQTLCIINNRADLAVAVAADGVHIGQDDLPVAAARKIVGPHRLIGLSTHSLAQAEAAVLSGADYIGCGPTFPSQTKTFAAFPGVEFLRQVAERISLPAFAIGGITGENIEQVLAAGFHRIAVSGAVTSAINPERAVQELQRRLRS